MKKVIFYKVNTIFAVSMMAIAAYAAADLIIDVSANAEVEFTKMNSDIALASAVPHVVQAAAK